MPPLFIPNEEGEMERVSHEDRARELPSGSICVTTCRIELYGALPTSKQMGIRVCPTAIEKVGYVPPLSYSSDEGVFTDASSRTTHQNRRVKKGYRGVRVVRRSTTPALGGPDKLAAITDERETVKQKFQAIQYNGASSPSRDDGDTSVSNYTYDMDIDDGIGDLPL